MNDAQTRSKAELLELLFNGVLDGRVTPDHFRAARSPEIAECWRWAIGELRRGPTDPKLAQAVAALVRSDPDFPPGLFLLGLALKKVGRNKEALRALEAVAEDADGPHAAEAAELSAMLKATIHTPSHTSQGV